MMASFMSYFTGKRDSKQTARDAIVSLREQLMMIEKKEEHLQRQIAQDLATAKANAVSNKNGAHSPTKSLSLRRFFEVGVLSYLTVYPHSGHCCAQAEKDARGGPRQTFGRAVTARGADQHVRVGEHQRQHARRDAQRRQRSQGHSQWAVRTPPFSFPSISGNFRKY